MKNLMITKKEIKKINSAIRKYRYGWNVEVLMSIQNDAIIVEKVSGPINNGYIDWGKTPHQFVVCFRCGNPVSSHAEIIEKMRNEMPFFIDGETVYYNDITIEP